MINLSSKEIYLANGGLFGFGSKKEKEKEEKEEVIFSCRCKIGNAFSRLEREPEENDEALLEKCKVNNELVGTAVSCKCYSYKKKGLKEYGFYDVDCSK